MKALDDRLSTVRSRYRATPAIGLRFSLLHRRQPPQDRREEAPKEKIGGLLAAFKPYLSSLAKRLHDEVSGALMGKLERRERAFASAVNQDMLKRARGWTDVVSRQEKTQQEYARKTERQLRTIQEDTAKQMKLLARSVEQIEKREATQRRELEGTPREHLPLSARDTRRLLENQMASLQAALQQEMAVEAQKIAQEAFRRMREQEAHEELRRTARRERR